MARLPGWRDLRGVAVCAVCALVDKEPEFMKGSTEGTLQSVTFIGHSPRLSAQGREAGPNCASYAMLTETKVSCFGDFYFKPEPHTQDRKWNG